MWLIQGQKELELSQQFKNTSENQEPDTSKSVKRNKTLVKVRPGSSTKEALDEVTDKEEVVKTVLPRNKCSARTCQSFVKGNINSALEFISMIQAADIKTILKQNKQNLIRAINQAAYTVKDQEVEINELRVTVTLQKQKLDKQNNKLYKQNKQIAYLKAKVKALKDLVHKGTRPRLQDSPQQTQKRELSTKVAYLQDFDSSSDIKKSFDVQLLKIKSKLKANTDYYLTLKQKLTYVKSKLLDKAHKLVAPCLCPDALNQFTSVKEMLKTLY